MAMLPLRQELDDADVINIAKSREVAASIGGVWDTISNLENEKRHWPIIKNIKVLRRDGNIIEREATIMRGPMGKVKSSQTLILDPKRSIVLKMTKGPLIGTRKMVLSVSGEDETRVDVTWEFELEGIPEFAQSFVKNSISEVTESALFQIAKEAKR
jgi:carbon monoxide dehydrogenase subunit G